MRNIKIVLEYDGTDYSGWQYQPDRKTVQGEIEKALGKVLNEKIKVTGAGRTDQGVHALGQVANFFTNRALPPEKIRAGMNALVPNDIYARQIAEVASDFNSRFSARSKIYRYQLRWEPSPIRNRYYWFVKYRLDFARIEETVSLLKRRHDFRWFSVADDDKQKTADCDLMDISLTNETSEIIIKIEADRFLRHMVRGIVGFLIDVARGRFKPRQADDVFAGKLRDLFFAPPQGLFLMEVKY
jgi:tRNA pseudouridine38-40 synthase